MRTGATFCGLASIFCLTILAGLSLLIKRNYRYVGEWYTEEEPIADQTGPASAAAGKAAGFYVAMLIWVALSVGYNKVTKRQ